MRRYSAGGAEEREYADPEISNHGSVLKLLRITL
jgi:hypothetical protein